MASDHMVECYQILAMFGGFVIGTYIWGSCPSGVNDQNTCGVQENEPILSNMGVICDDSQSHNQWCGNR